MLLEDNVGEKVRVGKQGSNIVLNNLDFILNIIGVTKGF